MTTKPPVDLGHNIHMIDLHDLNMDERTGCYVLESEQLTIIETSASPSIPYLLEGLRKLNLDPKDIEYIIVTHIHLDHSGGAGLLLKECPNAKVLVHPRGERHLSNPSRLMAGAKAVYGDDFDRLFDPILPIPEDRLQSMEDGDSLKIGDRTLTFYDTPGHAKHHFSIHDSKSNGIFVGDTIGVYYQLLEAEGISLCLPSTSPNQFDPETTIESKNRIKDLEVDRIYFGHYGMHTVPDRVYNQLEEWMPIFMESGRKGFRNADDESFENITAAIAIELKKHVFNYLRDQGVNKEHNVFQILDLDLDVCAMGITDYLIKRKKKYGDI